MTWVVFVAYLALLLAVGEAVGRTRVASLEDYLLSGREHGTWVTAAALVATVIGAGSTIGAAGVAYYVGLSAGWYLLSAVPALLLLGFTLAPAYRELSLFSVPEYLERRYGPRAGVLAAALGLVGLVLFLSAQLYAMGALLERVTGVGRNLGLAVSAVAVIVYTWRGGNWAVHASDSVQVVWIVLGAGLAGAVAVSRAGGLAALTVPPVAAGFEALGESWFHPVRRAPVSGWDPLALGDTVLAWVIMSTAWHFAMQSTAQRILSSRDGESVRRACVIAAAALVPLAALFAPLLVGHYWDGATEAGALASMAGSGLAGVGWRATGLEAELGIHMLNVALPVAVVALLTVSWGGARGGRARRRR